MDTTRESNSSNLKISHSPIGSKRFAPIRRSVSGITWRVIPAGFPSFHPLTLHVPFDRMAPAIDPSVITSNVIATKVRVSVTSLQFRLFTCVCCSSPMVGYYSPAGSASDGLMYTPSLSGFGDFVVLGYEPDLWGRGAQSLSMKRCWKLIGAW